MLGSATMREPVFHQPNGQNHGDTFGPSCHQWRSLSTPLRDRYGGTVDEILAVLFRDPLELAHYQVLVDILEERGEFDFALGVKAEYLEDETLTRSQKERILFSLLANQEHLSLWVPQTAPQRWEVLPKVIPDEVVIPPEELHPSLYGFGAIVPLQLVSDGYGLGISRPKFDEFRGVMNECLKLYQREAISGITIVDFAYHGLNYVVRGSGSKGTLAGIQEMAGVLTNLWRDTRHTGFFLSDRVYDTLGVLVQSLGSNETPTRAHALGIEVLKVALKARQFGQNVPSIMEHGLVPFLRATRERVSVQLISSVGDTLLDISQEVSRLRRSTVRFFRDSFAPQALALRKDLTESRIRELGDLAIEAEDEYHVSHYLRGTRTARTIAILEALGHRTTPSLVRELQREFRHFEESLETQALLDGADETFRSIIKDLGQALTPTLARGLCHEALSTAESLARHNHSDVWETLRKSGYFHIFAEFGSDVTPALLHSLGKAVINHIQRCAEYGIGRAGLPILRLTFEALEREMTPEIVAAIDQDVLTLYANHNHDPAVRHSEIPSRTDLFEEALARRLKNAGRLITPELFRHSQHEALEESRVRSLARALP